MPRARQSRGGQGRALAGGPAFVKLGLPCRAPRGREARDDRPHSPLRRQARHDPRRAAGAAAAREPAPPQGAGARAGGSGGKRRAFAGVVVGAAHPRPLPHAGGEKKQAAPLHPAGHNLDPPSRMREGLGVGSAQQGFPNRWAGARSAPLFLVISLQDLRCPA